MKKKLLTNLGLLLISIIIILIISEIAIGFIVGKHPENNKDLYKASDNQELLYEMVPNLEGIDNNVLIKTNKFGFRDDDYSIKKPKETFRIVVLGDSFTFGQGVEQKHIFTEVLEDLLNENLNEFKGYEVLNFGVQGYSTFQETIVLKEKAMKFDPDLIIIGYYLNDPKKHYGDKTPKNKSKITKKKSFNLRNKLTNTNIYFLLRNTATKIMYSLGYYGKNVFSFFEEIYDKDSKEWKEHTKTLEEIKKISEKNKIPVFVAILPRISNLEKNYPFLKYHKQIKEECDMLGFKNKILYYDLEGMDTFDLRVNAYYDNHPNKEAHKIFAESTYNNLLENKLVK